LPSNTDPATEPNISAVVQATLANEPQIAPKTVERVVELKPFSAPLYESRHYPLPQFGGNLQPILILPFHAARTKFIARADFSDVIAVGDLSTLTSGGGFLLPAGGQDFATIGEVWAVNLDPANARTLSVWAEYALD
jgi:hypothetical protein